MIEGQRFQKVLTFHHGRGLLLLDRSGRLENIIGIEKVQGGMKGVKILIKGLVSG
jgi:hypothetical protein